MSIRAFSFRVTAAKGHSTSNGSRGHWLARQATPQVISMHGTPLAAGLGRLISLAVAGWCALTFSGCGGSGPTSGQTARPGSADTLTSDSTAKRQGLFFIAGSIGGPG